MAEIAQQKVGMLGAMRVLVTGGAGYIGSVMTEALLEHGEQVVVFDNLCHGYRDSVHPAAQFIEGDVGDEALLRRLLEEQQIEGVIHMAAYIEVGESMRLPQKYTDNNFARPVALLEAMRQTGVKLFVLSSTAAVYGNPASVPLRESDSTRPLNPYGLSKFMLEQALAWYMTQGLCYAALRYFNAAGATGRSGERHQPESHLIPLVLQAADGERPSIDIFGTDYDTPDGTCIRDYIHVRDLAEAHIIALRNLKQECETPGREIPSVPPDLASRAWNLGNGKGFSVREVIRAAEQVCGHPIPVREKERRPGDPARLIASSEKMLAAGWWPRHTDLAGIVESAWKWKQANRARLQAKQG